MSAHDFLIFNFFNFLKKPVTCKFRVLPLVIIIWKISIWSLYLLFCLNLIL